MHLTTITARLRHVVDRGRTLLILKPEILRRGDDDTLSLVIFDLEDDRKISTDDVTSAFSIFIYMVVLDKTGIAIPGGSATVSSDPAS